MPLEKMGDFFDSRIDGYEEHQLTAIESAQKFSIRSQRSFFRLIKAFK